MGANWRARSRRTSDPQPLPRRLGSPGAASAPSQALQSLPLRCPPSHLKQTHGGSMKPCGQSLAATSEALPTPSRATMPLHHDDSATLSDAPRRHPCAYRRLRKRPWGRRGSTRTVLEVWTPRRQWRDRIDRLPFRIVRRCWRPRCAAVCALRAAGTCCAGRLEPLDGCGCGTDNGTVASVAPPSGSHVPRAASAHLRLATRLTHARPHPRQCRRRLTRRVAQRHGQQPRPMPPSRSTQGQLHNSPSPALPLPTCGMSLVAHSLDRVSSQARASNATPSTSNSARTSAPPQRAGSANPHPRSQREQVATPCHAARHHHDERLVPEMDTGREHRPRDSAEHPDAPPGARAPTRTAPSPPRPWRPAGTNTRPSHHRAPDRDTTSPTAAARHTDPARGLRRPGSAGHSGTRTGDAFRLACSPGCILERTVAASPLAGHGAGPRHPSDSPSLAARRRLLAGGPRKSSPAPFTDSPHRTLAGSRRETTAPPEALRYWRAGRRQPMPRRSPQSSSSPGASCASPSIEAPRTALTSSTTTTRGFLAPTARQSSRTSEPRHASGTRHERRVSSAEATSTLTLPTLR